MSINKVKIYHDGKEFDHEITNGKWWEEAAANPMDKIIRFKFFLEVRMNGVNLMNQQVADAYLGN